ncbi:UNVERIFIED_CONTAM: hypothetical protein RMT77_005459 [Armadillidium vulgare]
MAVSFNKLLAIFSFGILMSLKLTSAGHCDSFKNCVLLQSCRNSLSKLHIPNKLEIERAYAAMCKAFKCSYAIKEGYTHIPDNSPVLPQCASLPVKGTLSKHCIKVLHEVIPKVVLPSSPYWLRVSVEKYYSTLCHIIQCLESYNVDSKTLKWIGRKAKLPF